MSYIYKKISTNWRLKIVNPMAIILILFFTMFHNVYLKQKCLKLMFIF